MENRVEPENTVCAFLRNETATWSGCVEYGSGRQALQIIDKLFTGRLFDFQSADINVVKDGILIGGQIVRIEVILYAMGRNKGAFPVFFHETVTTTVFLIGYRNRTGEMLLL